MKVLPFKIPKTEESGLIYQVDKEEVFYPLLHQHKEIQLSIILSGEGDLLAGDTLSRYSSGDVIVIGSDLPHLFRSDQSLLRESHMLTLFFTEDSLGEDFFELSDLEELRPLLKKMESGIMVLSQKKELKKLFLQVAEASKFERLILFFQMMQLMIKARTKRLSSFKEKRSYSEDEGSRMNKVMNLALSEFDRHISLDEVAELSNMTPNAFCKFFKQRTRKTFFEFLLEIRLSHAARLLKENVDKSIAEIAELSGFRNLSNFNRKFKSHHGMTPREYRKSIGKS